LYYFNQGLEQDKIEDERQVDEEEKRITSN